MANQLLATFYVQLSQEPVQTVWAAVQGSSGLTVAVESVASDPLRYKIDVERVESHYYDYGKGENVGYYPFCKAGAYECQLVVHFGGEPLERLMYITIQPDLNVYRDVGGTQVDLIITTATAVSQNPLNRQLTVNVANTTTALAARAINLNESLDSYKGTVFVKSNVPVDVSSNDLSAESNYNTWLQLADKIRMTRKTGDRAYYTEVEYKWSGDPIIQNNKAEFIDDHLDTRYGLLNSEVVKQRQAVTLGLEKMPLALPLLFESSFSLIGRGVNRYTGTGETVETTAAIVLPLTAILKTPHQIKITPEVLTLDEDNSYTSFITVEANDGVNWTLAPVDSRITVTPSNGTGRAAVIVKKAASFTLNSPFVSVPLKATSTVSTSTVSDLSAVHLEQYTPTTNALIPKQQAGAFHHSLTDFGEAGQWTDWTGTAREALDNLGSFPRIEFTLDKAHRIRSWSLQSVGTGNTFSRLATTLVLWGQTLGGNWNILDIAQTPYNFYSNDKIREDRTVHTRELVSKIRISVIAAQVADYGNSDHWVHVPQIQVFAGVPLLPKMTSNYDPRFAVRANSSEQGTRVFDREVSGPDIATVGNRAWYINNNHFLLEDVAENGKISQFGSYQSKGWLSLIFPTARLLGYLYSIDNLQERSDDHANTSYAASLYFEGRDAPDDSMTLEPSLRNWNFIDLVSLDNCLGHHDFDGVATPALIVQSNQVTIKTYVQNLGLPVRHDSFLMNRTDRHILRYSAQTEKWYDDGLRLEPGTTAANQFNNLTTAELLAETGQSRLNNVALVKGNAMQPPWTAIPDKAAIVNQKDAKRMMYDLQVQKWSEVPNNDAIYRVHNRTHYEDLMDSSGIPLKLAQLRCTVQSIMNTERPSVAGEPVAMPEMQLFGLPTTTINAGSEIATVSYLKAEDAEGDLHDILGRHQWLPFLSSNWYQTNFRFYVGDIEKIKPDDKVLYLDIHPYGNGSMQPCTMSYSGKGCYETWAGGSAEMSYYELYVHSVDDEKIIVSSGYVGGQP